MRDKKFMYVVKDTLHYKKGSRVFVTGETGNFYLSGEVKIPKDILSPEEA